MTTEKNDAKTVKVESAKPLTAANWTPDVVASILGTLLGIHLGGLLGLIQSFGPDIAIKIALLVFVLMLSFVYGSVCAHMELEYHRYYQQAFSLLTPLIVLFFTIALYTQSFTTYMKQSISGVFSKLNPLNMLTGGGKTNEAVMPALNYDGLVMFSVLLTIVVLLPFTIHAVRKKQFSFGYLLFLLIPAACCVAVLLFTQILVSLLGVF